MFCFKSRSRSIQIENSFDFWRKFAQDLKEKLRDLIFLTKVYSVTCSKISSNLAFTFSVSACLSLIGIHHIVFRGNNLSKQLVII